MGIEPDDGAKDHTKIGLDAQVYTHIRTYMRLDGYRAKLNIAGLSVAVKTHTTQTYV